LIVVAHISLFIALYIAFCLFGLMATRLNKHYYYTISQNHQQSLI